MIETIILGLLAVFFAYSVRFKNGKWGLKASFILIFIFLALRYNFGNDYNVYLKLFNRIAQIAIDEKVDFAFFIDQYHEPGWVFLNWFFRNAGFFMMTAVLAFFSCIIYYRFINKYVAPEYYWLAVFLYIFNPVFLLIQCSAMRQSVATMLFIVSLDYIYKKQLFRYILCIVFASLFHFTAIFLLPVYLLVFFNQKIRLIYGAIILAVYGFLFIFGQMLSPFVEELIHSISDKFDSYVNKGSVNSGLGFIYYSALFIILLYYESMQKREVAMFFKISIIAFLFIPMALIIDMTGRFRLYLEPVTIIVYPIIAETQKKPLNKIILMTMLVLLTLFQFFQFFYSDMYHKYFFDYHTIFSASNWH